MKQDVFVSHILVIEDNPGDFFLIEEYLSSYFGESKITNAVNYEQAKKCLADPNQNYTIIFLDLTLPDKFGEELIKSILNDAKDIPVVVLTGYSDISFGIKSLGLGVSDYLNKDELNPTLLHKSILYNIERKKKRIELEESKNRYSDLFHLSPIPMWVFDLETLYFLDVNQAAIRHYGYTTEEFLSMTIKEIRTPDELQKMQLAIEHWHQQGETVFKGKFNHIRKNGTQIEVEIQSSFIEFKGRPAKLILSNDVTEKNRYLIAIENQNEKLKEIAWIQSHKVRAPVARILSIVNFIDENQLNGNDRDFFLENLKISTLELDTIIKEISAKTKSINI